MRNLLILTLALAIAKPAIAQDFSTQEIVVTASRTAIEDDLYDDVDNDRPAVGLRRTADFLVQQVVIRGDTRDQTQRRQEIRKMLSQAVRLANRFDVELAYGEYVLTELTMDNVEEITLQRDNRPDSERVRFLVKSSLAGGRSGKQAEDAIAAYINAVPENGRAQMDEWGDATLSIVGPDKFRYEITQEIAQDAKRLTDQMGENYAVSVDGLNKPVQWARSGPAEVLLYIPYRLTVMPRP